jgi:hypothetical protein
MIFIKLTLANCDSIHVNPKTISIMSHNRHSGGTTIILTNALDDEDFYSVRETPEEIKELIKREILEQTK